MKNSNFNNSKIGGIKKYKVIVADDDPIFADASRDCVCNRPDNRPLCKQRHKRSRLFDEQAVCCQTYL